MRYIFIIIFFPAIVFSDDMVSNLPNISSPLVRIEDRVYITDNEKIKKIIDKIYAYKIISKSLVDDVSKRKNINIYIEKYNKISEVKAIDLESKSIKKEDIASNKNYFITNRWKSFDLTFGKDSKWEIISISNGYYYICKVYNANMCLYSENNKLKLGSVENNIYSGQWSFKNLANGYVWIKNKNLEYLHMEYSVPSVGKIHPNWWSAQWSIFSKD